MAESLLMPDHQLTAETQSDHRQLPLLLCLLMRDGTGRMPREDPAARQRRLRPWMPWLVPVVAGAVGSRCQHQQCRWTVTAPLILGHYRSHAAGQQSRTRSANSDSTNETVTHRAIMISAHHQTFIPGSHLVQTTRLSHAWVVRSLSTQPLQRCPHVTLPAHRNNNPFTQYTAMQATLQDCYCTFECDAGDAVGDRGGRADCARVGDAGC